MKICILTYDYPHKKTAQVYFGLHATKRHEIDFMIMPFTKRRARKVLFSHRPEQFVGCSAKDISNRDGNIIHQYNDWSSQIDKYDYFIVCGSNLIDKDFANSGKILNVHSGLIPMSRGLDSFKWAILKNNKLGNTLHIINEEADSGTIIYHSETPVFPEDDISTLAERHYQMEIWMLQNFDNLLKKPEVNDYESNKATMRMDIDTEALMLQNFEDYKKKYQIK